MKEIKIIDLNLTTKRDILNIGQFIKVNKKKLAELEKIYRNKVDDYMTRESVLKLENDNVKVSKTNDVETTKYDTNTVYNQLGLEYLKPDNSKISKEMKKLRTNLTPEQWSELGRNSVTTTRKGGIRIC